MDNPFTLDQAETSSTYDQPRRKKLQSLGLGGLAGVQPSETTSLEEQPLYGGATSKEGTIAEEAAQPSKLATELVGRAPAGQEATPLLGPEERLGNVLTGETGTYGPLNGEQRSVSLKDFFGPGASARQGGARQAAGLESAAEPASNEQAGPPPGLRELGYAKTGLQLIDKSGTEKYLKSLFQSAGGINPDSYTSQGVNMTDTGFMGAASDSMPGLFTPEGFPSTDLPPGAYDAAEGGVQASGAGGDTNYAAAGASALGLIASLYGLASGAQVTPQMILSLTQNGITTVGQLASLAASAGVEGAASLASTVGALGSSLALPLGVIGAALSVKQGTEQIQTGENRSIYNGISQLIGGPGAGALSGLITQNMSLQPYLSHRKGAAEDVAPAAIEQYQWNILNAFNHNDLSMIQKALGSSQSGLGSAGLNLPPDVAAALNIPANSDIASLPPEKFIQLLKAYSDQIPAGAGDYWFTAVNQVPYLTGHAALGASNAIRTMATRTFDSLVKSLAPQLAQMPTIAPPDPQRVEQLRMAQVQADAERARQAAEFSAQYNATLTPSYSSQE